MFLLVVILLCGGYVYPNPYKVRHEESLLRVHELVQIYFSENVALALAKVALARQILEDGLAKGPEYSCAGTGIGGENGRILHDTVFPWLRIGSASDGEMVFYTLRGKGAALCSAVVIARLYDSYVYRYMGKRSLLWNCIKAGECKDDPMVFVEWADRMYGPNHEAVRRIYR